MKIIQSLLQNLYIIMLLYGFCLYCTFFCTSKFIFKLRCAWYVDFEWLNCICVCMTIVQYTKLLNGNFVFKFTKLWSNILWILYSLNNCYVLIEINLFKMLLLLFFIWNNHFQGRLLNIREGGYTMMQHTQVITVFIFCQSVWYLCLFYTISVVF